MASNQFYGFNYRYNFCRRLCKNLRKGNCTCKTASIVKVCRCDFDVEIDAKRVQTVTADSDSETKQTTGSSSRFKIVTDKNTLTKTISDLRIFQAFCNELEISEHRKIQDIPVKELLLLLCRFLVSVRKRDSGDTCW